MFGDHKRLYKKLEAGGHKATAQVTEAKSGHAAKMTGVGLTEGTVGWKVTATITPEGEPPFMATFDCPESIYASVQVGSTMSVLYDPDDHSKVVREEGLAGGLDLMTHEIQGITGGKGNSKDIAAMLQGVIKDPAGFDKAALVRSMGLNATGVTQDTKVLHLSGAPEVYEGGTPAATAGPPSEDPVSTLTQLADLRDRGVLSSDEFETQKKRILGEN